MESSRAPLGIHQLGLRHPEQDEGSPNVLEMSHKARHDARVSVDL